MLRESILSWLNASDNYQAGLALLRETGYSGFTLTILAMGEDAYNRTRLESELRAWLDKSESISLPAGKLAGPGRAFVELAKLEPLVIEFSTKLAPVLAEIPKKQTSGIEPAAVEDMRRQTYQLLDERSELKAILRAKMEEGNSEAIMAERLPKAIRIKQITRLLDELYARQDFYNQNGYLPTSEAVVDQDDTVTLYNVRSYVSLYKGKLKKKNLTPEQRQNYQRLLDEYTQKKNHLEIKLKPQNDPDTTRQQTPDCERDPAPFPRT